MIYLTLYPQTTDGELINNNAQRDCVIIRNYHSCPKTDLVEILAACGLEVIKEMGF